MEKKRKFRDYQPAQAILFPPSVQDWLPNNHLAHFIDEVVYHIDLIFITLGQTTYVEEWIRGLHKIVDTPYFASIH